MINTFLSTKGCIASTNPDSLPRINNKIPTPKVCIFTLFYKNICIRTTSLGFWPKKYVLRTSRASATTDK